MSALTKDRNTLARDGKDWVFPVAANAVIFAGAIVAINAGGYAVPGATATTLKAVGVAQEAVDNTGGANGAISVKVRRGVFFFDRSNSEQYPERTDIGSDCYIIDDQTVGLTSGGGTRSIAGKIRDAGSAGVWVEF